MFSIILRHLVFLFVLIVWINGAQADSLGVPTMQNFVPKNYSAHGQNWIAVQDKRGVMYFGNTNGILEYDGARWNVIAMPHHTTTRGLAISSDGTI